MIMSHPVHLRNSAVVDRHGRLSVRKRVALHALLCKTRGTVQRIRKTGLIKQGHQQTVYHRLSHLKGPAARAIILILHYPSLLPHERETISLVSRRLVRQIVFYVSQDDMHCYIRFQAQLTRAVKKIQDQSHLLVPDSSLAMNASSEVI